MSLCPALCSPGHGKSAGNYGPIRASKLAKFRKPVGQRGMTLWTCPLTWQKWCKVKKRKDEVLQICLPQIPPVPLLSLQCGEEASLKQLPRPCSSGCPKLWKPQPTPDSLPGQVAWTAGPEDFCPSRSSPNSALASFPPSGQEEEEIMVNSFFRSSWEFPV